MPPASPTLQDIYQERVASGAIKPDAAQAPVLAQLSAFATGLAGYVPPKPNIWEKLTGKAPAPLIKPGFYLYGDVGRGKSMLMDLFYEHVAVDKKRRVHFHQFMLEIQERLRKQQSLHADDVLPAAARELAGETWLLCFDEFHVSNIADAMILGRLFTALFEAGVVIVSTSNWAPDDLYKNGLQRDRFLPFIDLIKQKMQVAQIVGAIDHRFEQLRDLPTIFTPLGDDTTRQLQGLFMQLTDDAEPEAIALPVQGRILNVTHAAKGVGFFNFDELCTSNLGPADYLALAHCFHTVMLDGVPRLTAERRNETLRFMTLIDALYEAHVKLFLGADAPPERLAPEGDHSFAFQRTVSRLMEMQSKTYRAKPHLAG